MVNIPTIYGDDWWMAYYCYTHISPRAGWLAWENTSKERRVGGDWNMFFRVDDDVFSILDISKFYSPTAEALGSSAIVKVSEQTGAAPKPIPPRFQSQGSQVKVPK